MDLFYLELDLKLFLVKNKNKNKIVRLKILYLLRIYNVLVILNVFYDLIFVIIF